MHAGQQSERIVAVSPGGALAASIAGVAELVDAAVTLPGVGDDGGARLDVGGDERVQGHGRGVGENRHPAAAEALRLLDFDSYADQGFLSLGSPAPESWLVATDERLVDLDRASEPLPTRT